jgi:hypothetical protein
VTSSGFFLVLDVWYMANTDQEAMSTWLISDQWTVTSEDEGLLMSNGSTAFKWTFLNASLPEITDSDYYEEFGVARRATRLRVKPHQSGKWSWLVTTGCNLAHLEPELHLHATKALTWMQEQLTDRLTQ